MSEPVPARAAGVLARFGVLSATYFAHVGFFNPYLPLWLKHLGLGLFTISLLTAVQSATRVLAPYAWGALSDRTGERVKLLRLGATVALVTSMGLWVDGGAWWLALVLAVTFAQTSAMMSLSEAAMAHLVSSGGRFDARRYGRVRVWGSCGFLVTVFAAGVFFDLVGMRLFPVIATASLAAVVVAVWRLPDIREAVQADGERPAVGPVLRQPQVRWFFTAVFFHVLSHIGIYAFLSLYLDSLGYSKTVIGLLWGVAVVMEITWFMFQGRWMGAMSLSAWLVASAVATAVRMLLTAGAASVLPLLVLAQMLHAVTFAAHHVACTGLLSRHFPGRLRGRGQALFTVVAYGVPGVLGGLLGGALSSRMGLQAIYWAGTGSALVALACALRVWRGRDPAATG